MGGAQIVIGGHETAIVNKLLGVMASRGGSPEPAFRAIGEELINSTTERFDEQKDPDGNDWVAPKLLKVVVPGDKTYFVNNKTTNRILHETARLRRSIVYQTTRNTLQVGSDVIYSAVHQFGATIKPLNVFGMLTIPLKRPLMTKVGKVTSVSYRKVRIPARPFLGITPENVTEMIGIMSDFFMVDDKTV